MSKKKKTGCSFKSGNHRLVGGGDRRERAEGKRGSRERAPPHAQHSAKRRSVRGTHSLALNPRAQRRRGSIEAVSGGLGDWCMRAAPHGWKRWKTGEKRRNPNSSFCDASTLRSLTSTTLYTPIHTPKVRNRAQRAGCLYSLPAVGASRSLGSSLGRKRVV